MRISHQKTQYLSRLCTSYTASWGSGNTDIVSRKARWIASRLILHPISLLKSGSNRVVFDPLWQLTIPGFRMLTHVHQKPRSQPCIPYPLRKLLVRRFSGSWITFSVGWVGKECHTWNTEALVKGDCLQTVEEMFHVPLAAGCYVKFLDFQKITRCSLRRLTWLTGDTSTTTTLSRGRFEVRASCMVVLPPMLQESDKSSSQFVKHLPMTNQTDWSKLKFWYEPFQVLSHGCIAHLISVRAVTVVSCVHCNHSSACALVDLLGNARPVGPRAKHPMWQEDRWGGGCGLWVVVIVSQLDTAQSHHLASIINTPSALKSCSSPPPK